MSHMDDDGPSPDVLFVCMADLGKNVHTNDGIFNCLLKPCFDRLFFAAYLFGF